MRDSAYQVQLQQQPSLPVDTKYRTFYYNTLEMPKVIIDADESDVKKLCDDEQFIGDPQHLPQQKEEIEFIRNTIATYITSMNSAVIPSLGESLLIQIKDNSQLNNNSKKILPFTALKTDASVEKYSKLVSKIIIIIWKMTKMPKFESLITPDLTSAFQTLFNSNDPHPLLMEIVAKTLPANSKWHNFMLIKALTFYLYGCSRTNTFMEAGKASSKVASIQFLIRGTICTEIFKNPTM